MREIDTASLSLRIPLGDKDYFKVSLNGIGLRCEGADNDFLGVSTLMGAWKQVDNPVEKMETAKEVFLLKDAGEKDFTSILCDQEFYSYMKEHGNPTRIARKATIFEVERLTDFFKWGGRIHDALSETITKDFKEKV